MSDSTETNKSSETRRKVGDILRDERILRDQDLRDVSKALAIRLPFMEAIENSEPQNLPGTAYALGFVRSYADYLGLDSSDLIEQYKKEARELEQEVVLNFPEPLPSQGVPVAALLFIGTILAILFYAAWWYLKNQGKDFSDYVPPLSQEQTQMVETTSADETEVLVATPKNPPTVSATDKLAEESEKIAEERIETPVPELSATASIVETENIAGIGDETITITDLAINEEAVEAIIPAQEEIVDATAPMITTTTAGEPENPIEEFEEITAPAGEEIASATSEALSSNTVDEDISLTQATDLTQSPNSAQPPGIMEDPAGGLPDDPNTLQAEIAVLTITEGLSERAPRIYGSENRESRVTLLAVDPTWVEVSKADGTLTLTRLLRTGDRYYVPDETGLRMVTGNAGGVMIIVDGQEIGVSGPTGAVRRDYPLDVDYLLNEATREANSQENPTQ